jgi:uncharacterized protein
VEGHQEDHHRQPLTGKKLDAILVTHAHSDHTGALPVVHEAFPVTPMYLTPPTADLVTILQRDALKIMHAADREDDVPLYSERQVESMVEVLRPAEHHRSFTVGEVVVTYLPASHILGASMIHLATPGGHVLFTGDYCVGAQRSVPGLVRSSLPVDLLVTESTYGNRMHADRRVAEARLVQTIAEVVDAGGRVLVPAFAIGRAQEVLLILKAAIQRRQMPDVPVFVDGMVRAVCGVYGQHERYVTPALARDIRSAGHPFFTGKIQAVTSPRDRKHVLDAGACVIVSSSGMLHGGPSAYYAAELAGNEGTRSSSPATRTRSRRAPRCSSWPPRAARDSSGSASASSTCAAGSRPTASRPTPTACRWWASSRRCGRPRSCWSTATRPRSRPSRRAAARATSWRRTTATRSRPRRS